MPSIEDVWLTVLDDDDDFKLPQTYSRPQLPVQKLYRQEVTVVETVFNDLLADHLQWIEDVAEDAQLDTCDEYDYLV
jgi:hypothetical protein